MINIKQFIDTLDKYIDNIEERIYVYRRRRRFRRKVLTYKKMKNGKRKRINHTPFTLPKSRH